MLERKSWASSANAKTCHALFLCLAHNLIVLLEKKLLGEGVDNVAERERKKAREKKQRKTGTTWVATALQSFTVRSVKFVRWLRNFVCRRVPWDEAVARLRTVYSAT